MEISQLVPLESSSMQALVNILLDVCSSIGEAKSPKLRQELCRSARLCLEIYYRKHAGVTNTLLTQNEYARLVELIACGGKTQGRALTDKHNKVRLVQSQCPLDGNSVRNKPALCQVASSLLGDIATRNFGYAKVSIEKQSSKDDPSCEMDIYLEAETMNSRPGDEYFPNQTFSQSQAGTAPCYSSSNTHRLLPHIVAYSNSLKRLLNAVDIIAPTSATVLISGETGVGKELIARRLHAVSDQAAEEFVVVNCGAIPEELADSALFGHEKGAFTGAREKRKGYFERAENGTLFLDEINSLPTSTQARLLRVLQDGDYEKVGGHQALHSNARIVVASNSPLDEAVQRGEFRKDLWFRLNIIDLHIPPLRESRENIPHLVEYFLGKLREKYHKKVDAVSDDVMRRLYDYSWPGNVRELKNILERSIIFADGNVLNDIQLNTIETQSTATNMSADPSGKRWQDYKQDLIEQAERRFLECSLQRCNGDVDGVANDMGLTKRSIYLKLCRYGLDPTCYRS